MRLQKFMAKCGVASRRKSEEIILAGKVKVNGSIVKELGFKIDETKDTVVVDGKLLESLRSQQSKQTIDYESIKQQLDNNTIEFYEKIR